MQEVIGRKNPLLREIWTYDTIGVLDYRAWWKLSDSSSVLVTQGVKQVMSLLDSDSNYVR